MFAQRPEGELMFSGEIRLREKSSFGNSALGNSCLQFVLGGTHLSPSGTRLRKLVFAELPPLSETRLVLYLAL